MSAAFLVRLNAVPPACMTRRVAPLSPAVRSMSHLHWGVCSVCAWILCCAVAWNGGALKVAVAVGSQSDSSPIVPLPHWPHTTRHSSSHISLRDHAARTHIRHHAAHRVGISHRSVRVRAVGAVVAQAAPGRHSTRQGRGSSCQRDAGSQWSCSNGGRATILRRGDGKLWRELEGSAVLPFIVELGCAATPCRCERRKCAIAERITKRAARRVAIRTMNDERASSLTLSVLASLNCRFRLHHVT